MNVSFIRCTNAQAFDTAKEHNQLVEGALYFLTIMNDPLILSIVRVDSTKPNGYEVILGNAIASAPTLGANGQSLTYFDAGGNGRSINLSAWTIGDKTLVDTPIEDYSGGGVPDLLTSDTVAVALAKLKYLSELEVAGLNTTLSGEINTLRGMITSMFSFKGDTEPVELWAKNDCHVGSAWRASVAGDYSKSEPTGPQLLHDANGNLASFNCEVGDILMVVADRLPGAPVASTDAQEVCWTVIQNNIDLTAVMASLGEGAGEGKIITAMTYQNGVVTTTYSSVLDVVLAGWAALEVSGAIAAGDTLAVALHKLENRLTALETVVSGHTNQLTWQSL